MARSYKALSGCFESMFAIGLLTFLLVQATLTASTARRRTTGIRRDIETLNPPDCAAGRAALPRGGPQRSLYFLHCRFGCRFQQFRSIILWIAFTEHRVACHQNFSA